MNNRFILQNCIIVSPGSFIGCGEILVENGIITSVCRCGETDVKSSDKIQRIDLDGRIAMPGFVNPHAHLYSSLSTGLSPKGPNNSFTEVLSNFWWPLDAALDEESVYYSAVSGILDAIKHGVTCIFDHHASMYYVKGSLPIVKKAFDLTGIKGVLCFEASDRDSSENISAHLEENVSFIESNIDNSRIHGMIGLHANFTLCRKSLNLTSDIIRSSHNKYPIHVHCGEGRHDLEFCIEDGYHGPVDRLESFNLVNEKSILAHCIHLSGRDYDILKEIKPWVISNPESNANNRVGMPDRSRIGNYLIGTDGMSFDMISSLRAQYLLGRGLSEDFGILRRTFIDQPQLLLEDYFPGTGKIEKGFSADIAVIDYIPETPCTSENIAGHLIFGARGGRVYMTISDGNILYQDGKITFTFESSIRSRIKASAEKLHRRYYG